MSDDVTREALRGLRRDSLRAQRRREPALMVSIGLAEPEDDEMEEEGEDEETAPAGQMLRNLNQNPTVSKAPSTDPGQRRRRRGL